jgi:hypothetical protein
MKDFVTKLKIFESLFLYNFSTYDKVSNKLKIYFFSPDQRHQYMGVDLSGTQPNHYECEIGDLYLMDNQVFEDTPTSIFAIDKTDKQNFQAFHNRKNTWDKRDIPCIIKSFSTIKLTM